MEVSVTSPESCKRVLDIKAGYDDFKDTIEKAFVRTQRELAVPGFRKGKAPMQTIKTRYKSAVESDVLPDIIADLIATACREQNISALGRPQVKDFTYNEGKDLSFKAEVEVRPQIELTKYKGIKVEKKSTEVTPTDVENYIKYMQDSRAEVVKVQRPAQENDYLVAEFQEMDKSGVPLIGKKTEKREYQLGRKLFGAEFDQKLAGIKAGEQRLVRVTVPADYENKNVAGQEICFQIKAQEVLEKKLPAQDDAFAKEMGYETFAAMQTDTTTRLRASRENQEKERLQHEIMSGIIQANPFDVPPSLVDNYLAYMYQERKKYQPNLDPQAFTESSRPYAIFEIKREMLIDEIAKKENLTATDADLAAHVEQATADKPDDRQKFDTYLKDERNRQRLRDQLSTRKVLDFLDTHNAA